MSRPQFTEIAWDEYIYWINQDKRTTKKINSLIKDIMRNGVDKGIGSPEPLKGDFSGCYSRHINKKDRLVYRKLNNDVIEILSCKDHYNDN